MSIAGFGLIEVLLEVLIRGFIPREANPNDRKRSFVDDGVWLHEKETGIFK